MAHHEGGRPNCMHGAICRTDEDQTGRSGPTAHVGNRQEFTGFREGVR